MKLLVIEDDLEFATFLARDLRVLGHDVVIARDGRDGLFIATDQPFDAIVLDRMLPLVDGVAMLKKLRGQAIGTPVLMLTALGDVYDRVEGLDAGADDYLVKPVEIVELNARLTAILRRPQRFNEEGILRIADIEVNLLKRRAYRGGVPVALQPLEFSILAELIRNVDRVVTRRMLLESVWGYHFDPETNIVDAHVSRLRTRLNVDGRENLIVTVRGAGYMLREPR